MREFEEILDKADRDIRDEKEKIFGYVIIGLEKFPNARIIDILKLKEIFDKKSKKLTSDSRGEMPIKPTLTSNAEKHSSGMSRAERRAMERMNRQKVGSNKKKKK